MEVLLIFSKMLRVPNANLVLDDNNIVFRKSPFSSAHPFVFSMPMFLLAFNCTICSIPTTPINGLSFTIETLKRRIHSYVTFDGFCFPLFVVDTKSTKEKYEIVLKYIHLKFNSKRLCLQLLSKSTIEIKSYFRIT